MTKKPIFIISVGRSGSTLLYYLLLKHPEIAWFYPLCAKYPSCELLNRFAMRLADVPGLRSILIRGMHNRNEESYPFWEHHFKGFSIPFRDLFADDVTLAVRQKLRHVMPLLTTSRRNRLLFKITGWSRIAFLHEVYPDAKFIHIVRDGRAVANSLVNVDWWWGWRGPENWRWGALPQAYRREWEKYEKSFVALAALQWKLLTDAVEKAKEHINPSNFMEVRYEDLCASPESVFKNIITFCDLEMIDDIEKTFFGMNIVDQNIKWRKELAQEQQKNLNTVLAEHLKRYGYE